MLKKTYVAFDDSTIYHYFTVKNSKPCPDGNTQDEKLRLLLKLFYRIEN